MLKRKKGIRKMKINIMDATSTGIQNQCFGLEGKEDKISHSDSTRRTLELIY